MCKTAENTQLKGNPLTKLDYKFFFFPWYNTDKYTLDEDVFIDDEKQTYFKELEDKYGIQLTRQQKNWYIKKEEEQGDKMFREYPTTPEEAFRASVDGAVFGREMRNARKERRISLFPYNPAYPVNTFWDIGRDMTSIWFHQQIGSANVFIDFYQETGRNIHYFAELLLQNPRERFSSYKYGKHHFPHDGAKRDFTQRENKRITEVAHDLGFTDIVRVDRAKDKETDAIDMGRQALATCYFDENLCKEGITGLELYRYEYNEKLEVYSLKPMHNAASHPADAFMQFAQGYEPMVYSKLADDIHNPLTRVARTRARHKYDDDRI
jgi:hypothetical protein